MSNAPHPPNGPTNGGPQYGPSYGQPPQPAKKKPGCFLIGCLGLVAVVLVVGIVMAVALSTGGGTVAEEGRQGVGNGSAEESLPKLGTAVVSGSLEFTLGSLECGVTVKDVTGSEVEPQGQFCKVDVTIKNVGKQEATVDQSAIKLIDADEIEYAASDDTLVMVEDTIFYEQVNPGNSIAGIAYFDIPEGVTPVLALCQGGFLETAAKVDLT
ncbi:DUF4352 domain-containing protein [Microlunatus sp. Y2014]|uniref:DUF4352 domain-containing protein n=1 Tax=Microlunatus sp. Y2014 TaxID=3418488 RepID=UPI003DA75FCE